MTMTELSMTQVAADVSPTFATRSVIQLFSHIQVRDS